jgi:uncharacterized repeat protein (TIGR03803 family)
LDPSGRETVLHRFTGGPDGGAPYNVNLVEDAAGRLYGTAMSGGNLNAPCKGYGAGCGVVFELDTTTGKERVLHAFSGGSDGAAPIGGLVLDRWGNLYGTTTSGGDLSCVSSDNVSPGCGVVFKLSPAGNETVLYTFPGDAHGGVPNGSLIEDADGNLYGTTINGGDLSACSIGAPGCGVVFKVTPH